VLSGPRRIGVVVPAHDEQELLPACLATLQAAAFTVAPLIDVEIIVVADACADDSVAVAQAGGAHVVAVDAHNVGAARAAGMRHALRHGADELWLTTTDADSLVATRWLGWQLQHAALGVQVLAGTVAVTDWSPWPDTVRAAWETGYASPTAAGHVHGANLGCDARAYLRLGGFADMRHDEDVDLVARAHAAGYTVAYDREHPVVTSARRAARAPAGFAAFLATLAA